MNTENNQTNQQSKTARQLVEEILRPLHPDADLADDETLFAIIYDDYDAYADTIRERERELREAEIAGEIKGRNEQISRMMNTSDPGDGIPLLRGAHLFPSVSGSSIFDIADNA